MGRLIALFMLTTAIGLVGYHLPTQETVSPAAAETVPPDREAAIRTVAEANPDRTPRPTAQAKAQTPALTPMEKLRAAANASRHGEASGPEKSAAQTAATREIVAPDPARPASAPLRSGVFERTDEPAAHKRQAPTDRMTVPQRTATLTIAPSMDAPSAPETTASTASSLRASAATTVAVPAPVEVRTSDHAASDQPVQPPVAATSGRTLQRFTPPAHLGAAVSNARPASAGNRLKRRAFNTRQFWENSVQRGL